MPVPFSVQAAPSKVWITLQGAVAEADWWGHSLVIVAKTATHERAVDEADLWRGSLDGGASDHECVEMAPRSSWSKVAPRIVSMPLLTIACGLVLV